LNPSLVVDVNVWVAARDATDRSHDESGAFLRAISRRGLALRAPAILILEVACALARRFGDAAVGHDVADALAKNPGMKLEPLTGALLSQALHLGTTCRLRNADALYAATAAMHAGDTLVTWDAELIDRAGAVTPAVWLAEQDLQ
jgi:predicted nucleic acid-binding protein